MVLPYNVWTDEEIKNRNVSEEGDYPFEVFAISLEKTKPGKDKKGNDKPIRDMMVIDFNYWDANGVIRKQRDWIVFMEGMDWKLRRLADTTDNIEMYDAKALEPTHLLRKKGVFTLGVKDFTGNDGVTKKMNFVKDYVKKLTSPKQDAPFIDDDIPL